MRIASTKNTVRGALFGTINKAIAILKAFILKSIIIHKIGVEYACKSSLLTSNLRVLNISESVFAGAVAFSLI